MLLPILSDAQYINIGDEFLFDIKWNSITLDYDKNSELFENFESRFKLFYKTL